MMNECFASTKMILRTENLLTFMKQKIRFFIKKMSEQCVWEVDHIKQFTGSKVYQVWKLKYLLLY